MKIPTPPLPVNLLTDAPTQIVMMTDGAFDETTTQD